MVPDLFREFAFSLTDVSAKAAQAAHDARQPEVDRLKALNAELLKALHSIAAYSSSQWVVDTARAAIASAERAGR